MTDNRLQKNYSFTHNLSCFVLNITICSDYRPSKKIKLNNDSQGKHNVHTQLIFGLIYKFNGNSNKIKSILIL